MASITSILREFPLVVLDGAFGTEIARRGFDTRDDLWAAKALFEKPELVKAVHRDYFEAGADVCTSASYQATVEGFEAKGFTRSQAAELPYVWCRKHEKSFGKTGNDTASLLL